MNRICLGDGDFIDDTIDRSDVVRFFEFENEVAPGGSMSEYDFEDVHYKTAVIEYTVANTVTGGRLTASPRPEKLANLHAFSYDPTMFDATVTKIANPEGSVHVYRKCRVVIMRPQSIMQATLALHKFTRIIRKKTQRCTRLAGIKPNNFVLSFKIPRISKAKLKKNFSRLVNDSGKFPGTTVRIKNFDGMHETNVAASVFTSGKVNIMGASSERDAVIAFTHCYFTVLRHVFETPGEVVPVVKHEPLPLDININDPMGSLVRKEYSVHKARVDMLTSGVGGDDTNEFGVFRIKHEEEIPEVNFDEIFREIGGSF